MEGVGDTQTISSSPSLLDLLSNTLVLDATLPYLSLPSLFSLARTSRNFKSFVFKTPKVFRYVDLSKCRGAYVPPTMKIDTGGQSFRCQRMDENLTEDEFYSGPLRGVFSKLTRLGVLSEIYTLVLDGLASVTVELVSEIISSYKVRILSVLRCVNLNPRKLQQLLCYVCREGRPEGTPRLQGMYIFGTASLESRRRSIQAVQMKGVTLSGGAQLGAAPAGSEDSSNPDIDPWYAPSGRIINEGYAQRSSWEETLQTCKGIIAFDAVLCTQMHSAMAPYLHEASRDYLSELKPGIPPLATVALGPEGCAGCGKAPAGTPIWCQDDYTEFPLLRPPPFSGTLVDACRPPRRMASRDGTLVHRRLITACTWCLANRHCESCHRWWCGNCFDPKKISKLNEIQRQSDAGLGYLLGRDELSYLTQKKSGNVKVYNNLCVENCLVGEMMAGAGSGGMWG